MTDVLKLLRAERWHDITLKSGRNVTVELPDLQDCLLEGEIPDPVVLKLMGLESTNGKTPTKAKPTFKAVEVEDIRAIRTFQKGLVRRMVKKIEGIEVPVLTIEDLAVFEPDEFDELAAYAMRDEPLPGK